MKVNLKRLGIHTSEGEKTRKHLVLDKSVVQDFVKICARKRISQSEVVEALLRAFIVGENAVLVDAETLSPGQDPMEQE